MAPIAGRFSDFFRWNDDEGNRLVVSAYNHSPDVVTFLVQHAGTSTVVALPNAAAEVMHDALGEHFGRKPPVGGLSMEIHHDGEWSALYVDGSLVEVGDTYYVGEKAFALLGVKEVTDDAFLRGQSRREGVCKTLEEVVEYRRGRAERATMAARLKSQAATLLAQAAELEGP